LLKKVWKLQRSLRPAEDLLEQGHGREAVQETIWLLETVTTAFRNVETESVTVEGKFFNRIVRELRHAHAGTPLDRILEWATALHGYLSSPTGGAVRHGLDLREGLELSPSEARLFCNRFEVISLFCFLNMRDCVGRMAASEVSQSGTSKIDHH
jgi:hypothetical protein